MKLLERTTRRVTVTTDGAAYYERVRLVPVLTRWRPDPPPVYVVYSPSRRYSTKVRVFVDWARTLL